jgi:hypothetical protein
MVFVVVLAFYQNPGTWLERRAWRRDRWERAYVGLLESRESYVESYIKWSKAIDRVSV